VVNPYVPGGGAIEKIRNLIKSHWRDDKNQGIHREKNCRDVGFLTVKPLGMQMHSTRLKLKALFAVCCLLAMVRCKADNNVSWGVFIKAE